MHIFKNSKKIIRKLPMLEWRKIPSYIKNLNWYINQPNEMPIYSNLDEYLPLPELNNVKILWPNTYSWRFAESRLGIVKKTFAQIVPITYFDVKEKKLNWHNKGGFPVPNDKHHLIGKTFFPKNPNDIRGEVFEVHFRIN